jgi:hypothetical protein
MIDGSSFRIFYFNCSKRIFFSCVRDLVTTLANFTSFSSVTHYDPFTTFTFFFTFVTPLSSYNIHMFSHEIGKSIRLVYLMPKRKR